MLALTTYDAAALLADATGESFTERQQVASLTLPKLHKGSLALAPVMLKSALFRPGSGERQRFNDYSPVKAHAGAEVQYRGEELRQDDERVLMALLKLRSGKTVNGAISIVPRAFCRELGWADSSDSAAKLQACIERLHSARIRVAHKGRGVSLYSLVSDAQLVGGEWHVWLSERLAQMFESNLTYLDMDARFSMRDGLESWFYGFIKADACLAPFELADLRDMSLPSYELKDYAKHAKRVLGALLAAGHIKAFEVAKGRVAIKK